MLEELLELLEDAHRYSHYIVARCPMGTHDDNRPSFLSMKIGTTVLPVVQKEHEHLLAKLSGCR